MNTVLENTKINILIVLEKLKQLSQLQNKWMRNVSELKLNTKTVLVYITITWSESDFHNQNAARVCWTHENTD